MSPRSPPLPTPSPGGLWKAPTFGGRGTVASAGTLTCSPPHVELQASTCAPTGTGHRNLKDGDRLSGQGPHHGDAGQAPAGCLLSPAPRRTQRGCGSAPALLLATLLSNQFTTTRRGGW